MTIKPKKIHIIGIYGSGKSTLAEELSKLLKIKTYDLDEIKYKRKYDIIRPVKDRLRIVKSISKKSQWITEGAWLDYALDLYKKADLVIFLQIPKRELYKRIVLRHFKRKLNGIEYSGNNFKNTLKILNNVRKYFEDPTHFMTIKSHKKYLKQAKNVIIIKNKQDIRNFLHSIK